MSNVKQLELGSLWNLEACLVPWLEMHFCKENQHVWENILIEGGLHRRFHNIPLNKEEIELWKLTNDTGPLSLGSEDRILLGEGPLAPFRVEL